ncbi:single-strand DNA-binding protein [Anaeroplasma bactoclasticum]|jgi:single-strand DNA-binding protein|uniref:Single-stranded DNA-binding protein n=1 Tax=Anaeroplasma bactoclasticum TaxID=2088 RepID=A0A397RQM0_9MOLU|nr:single-stranded DNA-binding protein [Anaeroplasma bactoclasticum]RIA75472.1 single-strand DNA-binding protein [Anaeroplasma bactoclasticum]
MNKVILTGRITKDPELRYTPNGMATLSFSIAVDRQVRNQDGTRQADFINCVAWGQQADFMSRYVHKGNMLAIAGRIQSRSYQGQDGQTRYVTEVVVENVENMTPRDPNQAPQANFSQPQQNQYQGYNNPGYGQKPQQPANATHEEAPNSFGLDDDSDTLPWL